MKNFKSIIILAIISITLLTTGCSKDDGPFANITLTQINSVNTGDGDFVGNGGSSSKTFAWKNNSSTAGYSADITASTSGIFQMIIKDANGVIVLDRSLNGSVPPDSFSGVTAAGAPGMWTVTINVSNFNGDGSFSLSQGT